MTTKPKAYDTLKVWEKFLRQFHKSAEAKRLAPLVRQKIQAQGKSDWVDPMTRRDSVCVWNPTLAQEARAFAEKQKPRVQNWTSAKPTDKETTFSVDTNDLGNYSSKCRYTRYTYTPRYRSFATIAKGGCAVIYKWGEKSKLIKAPSGMRFENENGTLLVRRLSDGMDYHPSGTDLEADGFAGHVRKIMAENYKKRQTAKREMAAHQKVEKTFLRDVRTTLVTLNDSRAAGNCVEGSLQFAERKLHIPREEILAGGHLFAVPAVKLMEAGKGEPRVEQAVRKAWMRETTISI